MLAHPVPTAAGYGAASSMPRPTPDICAAPGDGNPAPSLGQPTCLPLAPTRPPAIISRPHVDRGTTLARLQGTRAPPPTSLFVPLLHTPCGTLSSQAAEAWGRDERCQWWCREACHALHSAAVAAALLLDAFREAAARHHSLRMPPRNHFRRCSGLALGRPPMPTATSTQKRRKSFCGSVGSLVLPRTSTASRALFAAPPMHRRLLHQPAHIQ